MKDKFGPLTQFLLEGNQQADKIASNSLSPIKPLNQNNPFLPNFLLAKDSNPLDSQSTQEIYNIQITQLSEYVKNKKYKASSWLFNPSIDQKNTMSSKVKHFDDYLHRATHKMLNPKSRLTYIANRPCPNQVPENKWKHLQDIFKNPNCHLCPNQLHNHQHLLSTCPLTIAIHDNMLKQMNSLLKNSCSCFSEIQPWFSTSTINASTDPKLEDGDKGLIPSSFIPSIVKQKPKSKDIIEQLLTTFQTYMVAKWKLHTHANLNRINSINQIKSNTKLLQSINVNL